MTGVENLCWKQQEINWHWRCRHTDLEVVDLVRKETITNSVTGTQAAGMGSAFYSATSTSLLLQRTLPIGTREMANPLLLLVELYQR